MRRTLSLCVVAAMLSGCGLKVIRVKPDPMAQPATKQEVADLRKDLTQSFTVLYQALTGEIRKVQPVPAPTPAPEVKKPDPTPAAKP